MRRAEACHSEVFLENLGFVRLIELRLRGLRQVECSSSPRSSGFKVSGLGFGFLRKLLDATEAMSMMRRDPS